VNSGQDAWHDPLTDLIRQRGESPAEHPITVGATAPDRLVILSNYT
jgi:hypothetical protein